MKTKVALFVLWIAVHGALVGCGKDSESNGSSKSAQQAEDAAPGPCIVPDAAVTLDGGDGEPPTGCQLLQPVPSDSCRDEEYLLACHGGIPDFKEPDPSLACHPPDGQPIPGNVVYRCCPCH
jgi:hypothetical protein